MNFTKPSVSGVDIKIQALQTALFAKLCIKWELSAQQYNAYGRAYNNATQDGYTPEVYTGGNEYKEVYYDDTVSASSFFGIGENTTLNKNSNTADVFLIFMVNLSKVKPLPATTRNDEEVHIDVLQIVARNFIGFTYTGMTLGINAVFKEYTGWRRSKGIKFTDTHPQHCFRLNFKLLYNPFLNCPSGIPTN